MRLSVNHALSLVLLIALNGCALGGSPRVAAAPVETNGPAADYPVRIGEPFTLDGQTFTPVDKLNFDAVGYATTAPELGALIAGAHKTLPLPSYVEVTSLDTGRTVLVRVTERGPMRTDREIALSPGAMEQLGANESTPVRVRRVNPTEAERAMLRAGMNAPERMETPRPLLDVLKRKLVTNAPLAGPAMPTPKPGITPVADPDAAAKPAAPQPVTPAEPVATPAPKPEPAAAAPQQAGNIVVQVAAFSTHERATRAAASFESAFVVKAGRFWRLQLGKFASTSAAQAALAKAKAAGYSDARIQRTAD